jgi:hypothetical protein
VDAYGGEDREDAAGVDHSHDQHTLLVSRTGAGFLVAGTGG